ncbi:nuclear speckle splicing regulatory protein 1-like [Homarus americanus]
MAAGDGKQYGLILPNKNKGPQPLGTRKLNPLLDSDDELEQDDEAPLNWVEASLKKSAGNSGQQSLQKRLLREALEEDASVFQYDEVYDKMKATKNAETAARKQTAEKKPKYIHNIIKHAEKRKLEDERRTERKVQKERDEEGEEFADKESFVTASYLKKMEELKQAEVEAKLEEMREEKIDVMRHKNFGVFYNHLFKQRMGDLEIKKEPDSEEEGSNEFETIKKREDSKRQKHYRTQRDLSESPERQMRGRPKTLKQRKMSSDSEDEERVESYRDRRDKYRAMGERKEEVKGKDRERDRDRGRERHQSPGRRRERDRGDKSRDRKRGRDRSKERQKNHRGRDRSRSRDRQRRRSKSRSPHSRRGDEKRRRDSHSDSPQKRSKSKDRVKVKEEPRSPNRKDKANTKENINDKEKKDINGKEKKNINDKEKKDKTNNDKVSSEGNVKVKKENELEEKEKRLDRIRKLFTKRTVGEKFEQSLQRFYQRKAERESQG